MDVLRRLGAEFFGTFWLTFAGCGSAVLAAGFPALGIGFCLAFGLTVLTMAYAVGPPSMTEATPMMRSCATALNDGRSEQQAKGFSAA